MKKKYINTIIVFTILIIHSCANTYQKIEPPIIPTPNFVLSENERILLCLDNCSQEINLDSLYTITNFNKVRSQFQLPENEPKGNLCFNLGLKLNKDSIKTNFKIQCTQPNYYRTIGQVIDHKYISVVECNDTSYVFSTD
jgi:hypothetical protein